MEGISGVYKLASADIACEKFDSEFVILNLDNGRYFSLSDSASVLMDGVLQGFDASEMARAAVAAGKAGSAEIRDFFAAMVGANLLAADGAAAPRPVTPSWQEDLQSVDGGLAIEAYDDLADVIRLDPIHEADEAIGWPVVKPPS